MMEIKIALYYCKILIDRNLIKIVKIRKKNISYYVRIIIKYNVKNCMLNNYKKINYRNEHSCNKIMKRKMKNKKKIFKIKNI